MKTQIKVEDAVFPLIGAPYGAEDETVRSQDRVQVTIDAWAPRKEYGPLFEMEKGARRGAKFFLISEKRLLLDIKDFGLQPPEWNLPLIALDSELGRYVLTLSECADGLRDQLIGPLVVSSIEIRGPEAHRYHARIQLEGWRRPR